MQNRKHKQSKRRWKYEWRDETGKVLGSSNDLSYATAQAYSRNLELRQRLSDIKMGKRKIEYRYKILRKITQQVGLFGPDRRSS